MSLGHYFFKNIFIIFFMYVGVLPALMSIHHMCAVPMTAGKGHQKPWNSNYRQLWVPGWVLRIEPGSSGRAATVFNQRAISLAPTHHFLMVMGSRKARLTLLALGRWVWAVQEGSWVSHREQASRQHSSVVCASAFASTSLPWAPDLHPFVTY